MGFFRTEKEINRELRGFFAPILYPNGHRKVARITYGAWVGYRALLNMGETDLTLMRAAKRMQSKTALCYESSFVMVATIGPWEEEN